MSDCIFEIHQLWQSGFSRVYSNLCCNCSFEAEIIKIDQSSHKIYSNNILNFQESTTILNAHSKKVWKLIVCTSYTQRGDFLSHTFFQEPGGANALYKKLSKNNYTKTQMYHERDSLTFSHKISLDSRQINQSKRLFLIWQTKILCKIHVKLICIYVNIVNS